MLLRVRVPPSVMGADESWEGGKRWETRRFCGVPVAFCREGTAGETRRKAVTGAGEKSDARKQQKITRAAATLGPLGPGQFCVIIRSDCRICA
jgi:hypothetical protein